MSTIQQPNKLAAALFLFMAVLPTASLYSQNITTSDLVWQANQAMDVQTQKTFEYSGQFKTHGIQSVDWVQKNGTAVFTYSVIATEGIWSDVSSNGSLTYVLSRNGKNSKMIIERNENGITITLDFSQPGGQPFIQRFQIQSVQPE